MFKSEDERRREAATASGRPCNTCGGSGTIGIGGRGAITASTCDACNGTGQRP